MSGQIHANNVRLGEGREDSIASEDPATLREQLALREAQLRDAQAQSRYYSDALRRQASTIKKIQKNAEKAVQEAQRKTSRARAEARDYQAHLADVYRSSSWRLTAPLRYVVRLLRGQRELSGWERMLAASSRGEVPAQALQASRGDGEEVARRKARAHVSALRRKMLELGFIERATADLEACVNQDEDPYLRDLAAWELAVWNANRYSPESAERTLELLDVIASTDDPALVKRAAVLRAESEALLGRKENAAALLRETLETSGPDADIFLGLCGLAGSVGERIDLINQALEQSGLSPVHLDAGPARTPYDRLHGEEEGDVANQPPGTRVTVIVPAYNAEDTIDTTLRALTVQTWRDLEIIVSDDCSTDRTCEIVEHWAGRDARVKLIRGESNSGPYVARNKALRIATGIFVTCNDADDWSHPRKIEVQARHLLENPGVIANTSEQARVTEDLVFYRRGNAGYYIQPNMSSLMFRSAEVVDNLGYWDSVRFAGDSEFTRRIKLVYGRSAVVDIESGPLSFQRQTAGSLTGSQAFGYHGYKMGARKEYEASFRQWHREQRTPFVEFPATTRPFLAPEPMRLERDTSNGVREFDIIMVSDFRMPGGTSMSNAEEIKAHRQLGLRTGLVQMGRYDLNPDREVNPAISNLVNGDRVDWVVHGEHARCKLMILRLPWVLQEWQSYIPKISADRIVVAVNQTPKRDYSEGSPYIYHPQRCHEHLKRYFGSGGTWFPIGPLVREALETRHRDELQGIDFSPENWSNIIDVNEWRRPIRPAPSERIRICKHSRDQYVKWPATADEILKVYPDSPRFEVHILGGADSAINLLGGQRPSRWYVKEFGAMHPAEFLADKDVFVYYTHPDLVEAFGRVMFEAMAVGVPVFLPPIYEPVFKHAAIYATPDELQGKVEALMADDEAYEQQVQRALEFVEGRFGYSQHGARIAALGGLDLGDSRDRAVLDQSDRALTGSPDTFTSLRPELIRSLGLADTHPRLLAKVLARADEAVAGPLHTVTDKTTLPPSGDPHDYWHPAPYWWPDPASTDGLPFIRRDGERVPGTLMFEPDSNKYDRTRVQLLFDDALALTLGWALTGKQDYADKAVAQLKTFFIDERTRMNPHLEYSQVKMGHNGNRGSSSGIIELKDFYYYLDAVRLMQESGALPETVLADFKAWLRDYLRWLLFSPQGRAERAASNNHGTYYDLQVAAISAFLGERACLFQTLRRARGRFADQFAPDGSQPEELTRTTTAHYCCFNLQGWINLDRLATAWGADLWAGAGEDPTLETGMDWLLSHAGKSWPYVQIDQFDTDRFIPVGAARGVIPNHPGIALESALQAKPVFHPHDGIRPWWNLDA